MINPASNGVHMFASVAMVPSPNPVLPCSAEFCLAVDLVNSRAMVPQDMLIANTEFDA